MIVDELTANGVMKPERLYESPYVDRGHVDVMFPARLHGDRRRSARDVNAHAVPGGAA